MTSAKYTVGEVAALAHVSVRALHHYDAIGLLVPSGRTERRLPDLLRRRSEAAAADPRLPGTRVRPGRHRGDTRRIGSERRRPPAAPAPDAARADRPPSRPARGDREGDGGACDGNLVDAARSSSSSSATDWLGDDYAAEAEQRWGDTEAWTQSQTRTAALHQAGLARDQGRDRSQRGRASPRRCEPANRSTVLTSRNSSKRIAQVCAASRTAPPTRTRTSPTCTSPTTGSASTTTTSPRASPSTSTTPSTRVVDRASGH